MPDTFQVAFDAPIVADVRGQSVTFPVLDIDDLLPWVAKLKAVAKADGLAGIPPDADAVERWRIERSLNESESTLDDLTYRVPTIPGGKMVFDLSLKKAGVSDAAERARIIKAIRPHQFAQLARDVSGLYPPPTPALKNQGDAGPNAPAGESAGESTGSTSST